MFAFVFRAVALLGLFMTMDSFANAAGAQAVPGAQKPWKLKSAEYHQRVWTMEDGLPQDTVTGIARTSDGYLWLATFGGLVRFDGVRFRAFDLASTEGLESNSLLSLAKGRGDGLWLGHADQGFSRFHAGVFTSYPSAGVQSVLEDRSGAVWLGTQEGLIRFHAGRRTTYTHAEGLPHDWVFALLEDRRGRLWVGTLTGLAWWQDGELTLPGREADGDRINSVSALSEGRKATVWLVETQRGTSSQQIVRFTDSGWRRVRLAGYDTLSAFSILEDRHGNVWVGGDSHVLRLGAGSSDTSELPVLDAFESGGAVRSLFEDRQGNVWAGSDGGGLLRFKRGPVRLYGTRDGFPASELSVVSDDGEGGVWVGTEGDGMARFHEGRVTTHLLRAGDALARGVSTIFRDRAGTLWFADETASDPSVAVVRRLLRLRDGAVEVVAEDVPFRIRAMAEDHQGDLWFGGGPNGLHRLRDGEWTRHPSREGDVYDGVWSLLEDRRGGLWIGLLGALSHRADGRLRSFTPADGMPKGMVRDIHEDADGVIWIATYGGGLGRLEGDRWTRYTIADGLMDNALSGLLADRRDNLWMLANLGLFYIRRDVLNDFAAGRAASVSGVFFGPSEGMAEANGGRFRSQGRTADGKMYFATVSGLAVVDPEELEVRESSPSILIESFRAGGAEIAFGEGLRVPPGHGDLEIRYTAPSLTDPRAVRFRYRLEGYDDGWTEAGGRRVAFYTNVAPGSYTFHVIAANETGVWNQRGAEVSFVVAPHFYESRWAMGLYGALFLGVVVAYTRLQRGKVEHERRIAEREREISAQLRDVDRVKGEMLAKTSHELRTPLYGILGLTESLLNGPRKLSEDTRSTLGKVVRSCRRLSRLVDGILELGHPEDPASTTEPPPPSVAEALAGPSESHVGKRILVVDDEAINRLLLSRQLGDPYRTTEAPDGPEALELLHQQDFDLVLLDVMMPKMQGFEVCRRARKTFPIEELPILFLTAKDQLSDVLEGYAAGGSDYLTKPMEMEELLARVEFHLELLSRYRAATRTGCQIDDARGLLRGRGRER